MSEELKAAGLRVDAARASVLTTLERYIPRNSSLGRQAFSRIITALDELGDALRVAHQLMHSAEGPAAVLVESPTSEGLIPLGDGSTVPASPATSDDSPNPVLPPEVAPTPPPAPVEPPPEAKSKKSKT